MRYYKLTTKQTILLIVLIIFFIFPGNIISQTKVIFDTDFNMDVDDVGALATLNAFMDNGEAEILACMTSEPNPYVCQAIDVINTWYHHPDIPIGAIRGSGSVGQYVRYLAENYPQDVNRDELPEPVELYRQILSQQPDSSVTIISVGYVCNLANLLQSAPDTYSPLGGDQLVAQKVKEWVCMGGHFPSGKEFNLSNACAAEAKFAIDNWPTPIIFTGWEIGKEIFTGLPLQVTPKDSPVRKAYELFYCSWAFDGNPYYALEHGHYSWDQTAVLIGVKGHHPFWTLETNGYNAIAEDGSNEWKYDRDSQQAYVLPAWPAEEIAAFIDSLMLQMPVGAYIMSSAFSGWIPLQIELDGSLSNPGIDNTVQEYHWQLDENTEKTGIKISHTFTEPGNYPVTLTMKDSQGNILERTEEINAYDPQFSEHPLFGNALYEIENSELWKTQTDEGDIRYMLLNGGEDYAILADSSYADFELALLFKLHDDLSVVRSANARFVFGFEDRQNFYYVMLAKKKIRIFKTTAGHFKQIDWKTIDWTTDNLYHQIRLRRTGSEVHFWFDGIQLASFMDSSFSAQGLVGFGAKNSTVMFDDVTISRTFSTGVNATEPAEIPKNVILKQNYPNPFNPETTIRFYNPRQQAIELNIYNLQGRWVQRIMKREMGTGYHKIVFNGANLASGIYMAVLQTCDQKISRKMTLLR